MIPSTPLNLPKHRWLPTFTARDMRVLNVMAPFVWVITASATYHAFVNGRVGEGIAHTGMLLLLFSAMVGPHFWGIVKHEDTALCKLLTLLSVLGMLTMAAGWFIRFTM